jgi:hypothetical protein
MLKNHIGRVLAVQHTFARPISLSSSLRGIPVVGLLAYAWTLLVSLPIVLVNEFGYIG